MTDIFPGQPENPKAAAKAAKAYAKATRPLYKKKRVIIPAAFVAIAGFSAVAGGSGSSTTTEAAQTASAETEVAPAGAAPAGKAAAPAAPAAKKPAAAKPAIVTSSKEMISVLEGNALKAKNTYDGKRVTVSGFVGNIDASGDYFSLDPTKDAFVITGVQVYTSEKFQDQVANFSKGQAITVTGKIDDVGELMGYSLKAETIK